MADAPAAVAVPFIKATRPQSRFGNVQTVSNLSASGSFAPIQLPASGHVRRLSFLVSATYTTSASAAVVAGDAPFNLISGITVTDATGTPVQSNISGYNQQLVNKYFPAGTTKNDSQPYWAPQAGAEFAYAASGTSGSATFRIDVDFEQDANNGYMSIPNVDSNASLQVKVDYAAHSVAFGGGTASAATLSIRLDQDYYAPVSDSINNVPLSSAPPGVGDYLSLKYETQTVSAAAENIVTLASKGGILRGLLIVSRASGTRTAFTAATQFGVILDNTPIHDGVFVERWYDQMRRQTGYLGANVGTTIAPLTAGTVPGIDTGVLAVNFGRQNGGRSSWLPTKSGSQIQLRITPGASATTLEVISLVGNVGDKAAFLDDGMN